MRGHAASGSRKLNKHWQGGNDFYATYYPLKPYDHYGLFSSEWFLPSFRYVNASEDYLIFNMIIGYGVTFPFADSTFPLCGLWNKAYTNRPQNKYIRYTDKPIQYVKMTIKQRQKPADMPKIYAGSPILSQVEGEFTGDFSGEVKCKGMTTGWYKTGDANKITGISSGSLLQSVAGTNRDIYDITDNEFIVYIKAKTVLDCLDLEVLPLFYAWNPMITNFGEYEPDEMKALRERIKADTDLTDQIRNTWKIGIKMEIISETEYEAQ